MTETISVIVPFYKGNQYMNQLFSCIERNVNTLRNSEIDAKVSLCIVNDSPDIEVVIPEGKFSFDFNIITQKKNSGIHSSRVLGVKNTTSDLILFLDQDDIVADNFFVSQLRVLKDADLVIANAYIEAEDGTCRKLYENHIAVKKLFNINCYINSHNQIKSPGQCLIRRSIIPALWMNHVMSFNGSDDLFLWMLMYKEGVRTVYNPECLYTHRFTGENLSDAGEKMNGSSLTFTDDLLKTGYTQKEVDRFSRSRKLSGSLSDAGGIRKVQVILKNSDLILSRAYWKIRTLINF